VISADLVSACPDFVPEAIRRQLSASVERSNSLLQQADALLTEVETRTSSPVKGSPPRGEPGEPEYPGALSRRRRSWLSRLAVFRRGESTGIKWWQ